MAGLARVDQERPNWSREIVAIMDRCFTFESTMFIDALGLLQDRQGRNVFYSQARFDLDAALNFETHRRGLRRPTEFDLATGWTGRCQQGFDTQAHKGTRDWPCSLHDRSQIDSVVHNVNTGSFGVPRTIVCCIRCTRCI